MSFWSIPFKPPASLRSSTPTLSLLSTSRFFPELLSVYGNDYQLAMFDPFTIGLGRNQREFMIKAEDYKRVYSPQGWIAAIRVQDGEIFL